MYMDTTERRAQSNGLEVEQRLEAPRGIGLNGAKCQNSQAVWLHESQDATSHFSRNSAQRTDNAQTRAARPENPPRFLLFNFFLIF